MKLNNYIQGSELSERDFAFNDGARQIRIYAGPGSTIEEALSTVNDGETFIASGALPSGAVVALRGDGRVEVVAESPGQKLGDPVVLDDASGIDYISSTFDPVNGKVIVAYSTGSAVVGTVSGNSISFGAPVAFAGTYVTGVTTTFDSTNGKVVIAYGTYVDAGAAANTGSAVVGTVSGNSISFGAPVVFNTEWIIDPSVCFDSTSGKVVIAYRNAVGSLPISGKAVVGTVSGTSISFGTPVVFEGNAPTYMGTAYDPATSSVVIVYSTGSDTGGAIVGTVSGTSISFGSPHVFSGWPDFHTDTIPVVIDPASGKVVVAAGYLAAVGSISGNSISFGVPVPYAIHSDGTNRAPMMSVDPVNGKIILTYTLAVVYSYTSFVVVGTVVGNSISFDAPTEMGWGGNFGCRRHSYDPASGNTIIAYTNLDNSWFGTVRVFDYAPPLVTNADKWVGVATTSASTGAKVRVKLDGQTVDNFIELSTGVHYYLADNGTLVTVDNGRYIGRALSPTKLRLVGCGKV